LTNDREILEAILANITQGLCLFDRRYRLVVSNLRFRELYGLTETAVRPGMHISELLDACKAAGNFSDSRRAEIESTLVRQLLSLDRLSYYDVIKDGRVVSVTRTPMADGGWVTTFEDVTEQKRVEDRIEYLAHHDSLTGLSSRSAFREKLDRALLDRKPKQQVALLYLDLDHFKAVNDKFGHPVGDELLRLVAARLRGCLRETSVVARLGGDEFAVIETDLTWADEAGRLAARAIEAISAPYQIAGEQIIVGTSIGIAMAPRDGTLTEGLVKSADTALYRAKSAGKNTYRYFYPSDNQVECWASRTEIESAAPRGVGPVWGQDL
jgi:diguanylate cyclase (GGDEF)-like protein